MLNWTRKDALLACKRCPFELLLTPFCRPIKHSFASIFTTYWYAASYNHPEK